MWQACQFSPLWRTGSLWWTRLDLDVDFFAPGLDDVRFYGPDGRKPRGFAGAHVECSSVVQALQSVAVQLAVGERKVLMGAPILEGIEIAVDVGQNDLFLPGFDIQEVARGAFSEVGDLDPLAVALISVRDGGAFA